MLWTTPSRRLFLGAILLLAWPGLAAKVSAQIGDDPFPRYSALTRIDRDFMADQRRNVDSLARSRLGRQIRQDKANDLEVLQLLVDRRLVSREDTATLQAMGVVLGDLLSRELDMPWVIFEDELGRSRALRVENTEHLLFPVTMISRLYEADADVDVAAVYNRAAALMRPHLPARPFQYDQD